MGEFMVGLDCAADVVALGAVDGTVFGGPDVVVAGGLDGLLSVGVGDAVPGGFDVVVEGIAVLLEVVVLVGLHVLFVAGLDVAVPVVEALSAGGIDAVAADVLATFDFFTGFFALGLGIKGSQALLAVLFVLRKECPFPNSSSPSL